MATVYPLRIQERHKWEPIYYSDEANAADDVQAAILNGRLDQKLHYKSPDATETWKKLINDQRYEQYDHCTEALAKFCDSGEWLKFVKNGIEGVVTLGAGSPSKDLQIIRVLRDQANGRRKIAHIVVDASPYMIEETRTAINRAILSDNSIQQDVAIRYCVGDFLKFQDTPIRRKSGGNVAWFILGGTFGNVNETAFFKSIAGQAQKGDLLIIAADIRRDDDLRVVNRNIRKKYRSQSVKNFVGVGLRAAWHHLAIRSTLSSAIKNMKMAVVEGYENGHSDIPGSATLEVYVMHNNNKLYLITSTRYVEQNLKNFAEGHEFFYISAAESDKNPNFKHLVFRYGKE